MRDNFFDDDVYADTKPKRRGRVSSRENRYHEDITQAPRERIRRHSREDAEPVSITASTFKYFALGLLVIMAIIANVFFMKVSAPISLIIIFIIVMIGIFLHSTPVFVSIILDSMILVVGMLTKTTDLVVCASCVYLATILVFKED